MGTRARNTNNIKALENLGLFKWKALPTPITYRQQKTVAAAEKWIKDTLKIDRVDYTGLDLELANVMNKTLVEEYNILPFYLSELSNYWTGHVNKKKAEMNLSKDEGAVGVMMTTGSGIYFIPESIEQTFVKSNGIHSTDQARMIAAERNTRERVTQKDVARMQTHVKRLLKETDKQKEEFIDSLTGKEKTDLDTRTQKYQEYIKNMGELAVIASRLHHIVDMYEEKYTPQAFLKSLKLNYNVEGPSAEDLYIAAEVCTRRRDYCRMVLLHEMGHLRENQYSYAAVKKMIKVWDRNQTQFGIELFNTQKELFVDVPSPTRYGSQSYRERWAEWYALYRRYPCVVPPEVAKKVQHLENIIRLDLPK